MIAHITIGLPASGKSSWAREKVMSPEANSQFPHGVAHIINNDDIRKNIYARNKDKTWSKKIEAEVKLKREEVITVMAHRGFDVIVDNTHINPKTREQIGKFCEGLGYEVSLVDFTNVGVYECVQRDALREGDAKVGRDVIMKMAKLMPRDDKPPPNWIADTKQPDCIIVDIDGTLAEMGDRRPFDESKVYNDSVRNHVLHIVKSVTASTFVKLFIFSGRSDASRTDTVRWLEEKCMLPKFSFSLHMRKSGDSRRDSFIKRELFDEHIKGKYNVMAVFDDRPQVIRECWNVLGLPVLNCGLLDVEF